MIMWNVECGNGKSLVSPVFILEAAHFHISTFHIKENLSYNHFSTIGYIDARLLRNSRKTTPLQVVVEAVAII